MNRPKNKAIHLILILILLGICYTLWGCYHAGAGGAAQRDPLLNPLSNNEINQFLGKVRYQKADAAYYYRLGRHFQQRGRHMLAIKEFARAVAIDPGHAMAFNAMGVSHDRLAEFDLAVQCYRRALLLAPDFAPAHNNLGYSFLMQGKPEQALAPLRKATALAGDNPLFQNNLMLAMEQAGMAPSDLAASDGGEGAPVAGGPAAPTAQPGESMAPTATDAGATDGPPDLADPLSAQADGQGQALLTPAPIDIVAGNHVPLDLDQLWRRPAWVAPRIQLSNGNGIHQMAHNLGRYLERNGFAIDQMANADHFDYPRTMIYYGDGQRQVASQLARLLFGQAAACELHHEGRNDAIVTVIAGHNIAGLNDLFSGRLKLQVVNGNGVTGAARELSDRLNHRGFVMRQPVNADHFGYSYSRIVYPRGCLANARFVSAALPDNPLALLVEGEKTQETIRIVLGKDFRM